MITEVERQAIRMQDLRNREIDAYVRRHKAVVKRQYKAYSEVLENEEEVYSIME